MVCRCVIFGTLFSFCCCTGIFKNKNPGPYCWRPYCAGGSVVYVSDTGIYLILAFYVYLFYLLAANHFLKRDGVGGQYMVPGTLFYYCPLRHHRLFWMAVGNHVFQPVFWNNMKEFFQFFLDGYEALPIYQSLTEHHFLQCLVGFIIPAVYMLTFLAWGA